jgi:hypothetical protein
MKSGCETKKIKRGNKITLPPSFQEVLILHEMKFDKGDIDLDLIRKLIYLYSVRLNIYNKVRDGIL